MKINKNLKFFGIILAMLLILVIIIIIYHNRKQNYINDYENKIQDFKSSQDGEYKIIKSSLQYRGDKIFVPLPPLEKLMLNYYDTDTSMYSLCLVDIAYSLNDNFPVVDPYNNHEKVINYLVNRIKNTLTIFNQRFSIINLLTFTGLVHTGYAGFIFEIYDPKPVIFIVLRGTASLGDLINDLKANFINPFWAPNIAVHYGFNEEYLYKNNENYSIRNILYEYFKNGKTLYGNKEPPTPDNTSKIIITGHSLGSAICNLITADMSQNFPELRNISKIFAFAPPYVGDERFADLVNKNDSSLFQIINTVDIVTYIGEFGGFFKRPKYQKFCFLAGSSFPTYYSFNHSILTYYEAIKLNKNYFDAVKDYRLEKICGLDMGDNFNKRDFLNCDRCQ